MRKLYESVGLFFDDGSDFKPTRPTRGSNTGSRSAAARPRDSRASGEPARQSAGSTQARNSRGSSESARQSVSSSRPTQTRSTPNQDSKPSSRPGSGSPGKRPPLKRS